MFVAEVEYVQELAAQTSKAKDILPSVWQQEEDLSSLGLNAADAKGNSSAPAVIHKLIEDQNKTLNRLEKLAAGILNL